MNSLTLLIKLSSRESTGKDSTLLTVLKDNESQMQVVCEK